LVFASIFFLLFFLPVFLSIYGGVADRFRNLVLLIASLLFYAYGAPLFIWVLAASTFLNFYLVRRMDAELEHSRLWFRLSLVLNVGLLIVFKYANFTVESWNAMGLWTIDSWTKIALPIGISFFTFQSLSYTIDVYRREERPLQSPFHYFIYIFSFPQMIAGPIVRFGIVAKELVTREFNRKGIEEGAERFIIGLAKKVIVANGIAASFPITGVEEWSTAGAWLALLAYTFQIYFDFSGYSDMAIGLGRIMGFHFPENFNRPYSAKSFTDFWRRWHMTLSFWMRDYLYIGLGGNRNGVGRTYANLLTVFVISGFWHGASWNFLLWGLYHGLFLIIERLFLSNLLRKLPAFLAKLWTFFWVLIGWGIFALVDDFERGQLFGALINPVVSASQEFSVWNEFVGEGPSAVLMTLALLLTIFPAYSWWERLVHGSGPKWWRYVAYSGLLVVSLAELTGSTFNPFIYFRF
jgi:alginate O-acetyltransferase complex protein AlgI